jgi:hypothetical protein
MRILLAIARYDYGDPARGDSYEYCQWFACLGRLGHDVELFDTFDPAWRGDPEVAGAALEARAAELEPDLVLMMLIEDEIPMTAVDAVRRQVPIANWFADDTWRFPAYSRHVAPHFSWVVTTCRTAAQRYEKMPDVRAYFRPWGYDPELFHPVDVEPSYDVGFVGQRYGRRGRIVDDLSRRGFAVEARGSGWPGGRIEPADLARQFASTKINLSFLESSAGPFQRLGLKHIRGTWRADRLITRIVPPPRQLKARPFEITACGGFLLTNTAPELPEFFRAGEEIAVFDDDRELVDRISHYLAHDDERRRVAAAGLERAQAYAWPLLLGDLLERVG